MAENDGLDCTVNFMGAVSELWREEGARYDETLLRQIVDQIHAMRSLLPGAARDFLRLDGSFETLDWTKSPELPAVDLARLQQAVALFLSDFVQRHFADKTIEEVASLRPSGDGKWPVENALGYGVPVLRCIFRNIDTEMSERDSLKGGLEGRFVGPLRKELARLEHVATSLKSTTSQQRQAQGGDGVLELFRVYREEYLEPMGMDECPAIIVASGLKNWSDERWQKEVKQFINVTSNSLGDALAPDRLDWLLRQR